MEVSLCSRRRPGISLLGRLTTLAVLLGGALLYLRGSGAPSTLIGGGGSYDSLHRARLESLA